MKSIRHTVRLLGFDLENGKISFSLLAELNDHLLRLSEGALRSLVSGNSTPGRGKGADWLKRSLNFQLTGVRKGSTVLDVDAPVLNTTLGNVQIPLFENTLLDRLTKTSALGLGLFALDQAIKGEIDSPLLDKHLLGDMHHFSKFLKKKGSSIEVSSGTNSRKIRLKKEVIDKIKKIEEQTPASIKTKVTGVLDILKHSNNQLELIVDENRRIRAILSDRLSIRQLTDYFGKRVTVTGIANYNPTGAIISFEISSYKPVDQKESYFTQLPKPLFEDTNLLRIAGAQNYKGYKKDKVKKLVEELGVEESLEELLAALK